MSELVEVSNYPVKYNPDIAELIELCSRPIEMFKEIPIEEKLENYKEEPTQRRSGIIEGLNYALRYSESDYRTISQPNFNGNIRHDNAVRADIADYYENRINSQAEEIKQFIDGLIQRDGWIPNVFGNYKHIKTLIDKKEGKEKALALNMLRICGLCAIPMDIRFEEVQIVESSIISTQRTQ